MSRATGGSRADSTHDDSLPDKIVDQRLGCLLAGSPFYVEVLDAVAADVAVEGPCLEVLRPHAAAPRGDAVLLRFLAGVHHLVLSGQAPELAAHYPSVGGTPGVGLGDTFVETVRRHVDELRAAMHLGVQTNEVGRSVALLTGLLALPSAGSGPLRLRLLEVGASAGLNLWLDRYRYESDDSAIGPIDSPVRFRSPWLGAAPDLERRFEVVSREGCDRAPIDLTDPAGRRRLRSYVWPDQTERAERLDAALAVAGAEKPVVVQADAVDWAADRLHRRVQGVVTVLFHTIMLQYLTASERRRFARLVDEAGQRATAGSPLVWLRMEPGGDQADVWLTTWPGGTTRLVARSAYHGPPVALAGRSGVPSA